MNSRPSGSKRIIGFLQGVPSIRMEEEEGPSRSYQPDFTRGFLDQVETPDQRMEIRELIDERKRIIDAISAKQLSSKELFQLLQENRACIDLLRGGSPSKFATELVIYAMLLFSAMVIIVLSWLTAMHNLNLEVTTTFVGTVAGGMIATIAQKLGKVGR